MRMKISLLGKATFCFSEYVDPGLFNSDHLSTWRQTIISDTAHEGISGLASQLE